MSLSRDTSVGNVFWDFCSKGKKVSGEDRLKADKKNKRNSNITAYKRNEFAY